MRNKKLSYKQKICIQRGSLQGAGNALVNGVAPEFESNENQQDETFGVDSHELTEHHLQAALSSHQLEATQTSTSGETKRAYHIPTPKTVEVLSVKQYNDLYPPNSYSDPVTYVRYSDTVESNTRGAPYCLDEDDQGWLDKHNQKAKSELEQALKGVKGAQAQAKEHDLVQQHPDKYLVIDEDQFETVMYVFERATCEHHPLLELDFAKVPTLDDLLPELDETSAAAELALPELPPYRARPTDALDGKPVNGKLAPKGTAAKKGDAAAPVWSAANPFRHLSLLKPCARVIYPWWRLRRQARDGKPIVPSLNFDESNDSDPYVCFRRREVKTARKTRKTDTLQLEKLVRLRSELMQATRLFEMVAQREQLKEEQVREAHACWTQAHRLLQVKLEYGFTSSVKGAEDENLIFGVQPDPTAPVPNVAAAAHATQLKKKRKADEAAATPTTLKLRRPKPGEAETANAGKVHATDSATNGIGAALLERVKAVQAYIERETQWHQQTEAGFEDLTDAAFQPLAAPLSQRAFRPVQSDTHDTQFWSNHPLARLGRQPCFRRRVGRGGRVYLDRRPLTVSPAPASVLAWPRGPHCWPPAPGARDALRTPGELSGTQRPMMFASRLRPALLPTPDFALDAPPPRSSAYPSRDVLRATRMPAEGARDSGAYTAASRAEVASTSSASSEHSKSSEDVGDGQSTQATDIEQDVTMHESKDFGIASDSEDELPSPEEQRERALKLAERWRYDEDGGRWAGLGLLGLGGMEGDEEAVLDDYDHRFVRYRMSLLDETNLLKLSTDWTYMRQALAAAGMHPSDAQAAAATKPGAQPTANTKQAHPAHDEQAAKPAQRAA